MREFIKNEQKSSLSYIEMELNVSKVSVHTILTEHSGLRKVCALQEDLDFFGKALGLYDSS